MAVGDGNGERDGIVLAQRVQRAGADVVVALVQSGKRAGVDWERRGQRGRRKG